MPGKPKFKPNRRSSRRARKQVQPTKLVSGEIGEIGLLGDGVLHVDKQTFHVPYTAPGDQGIFAVTGQRGTIDTLEHDGIVRREPPCPHHGSCGGCQMQHLEPDYYEAWKTGLIRKILTREGFGDVPVLPLISSGLKTRRRAGISLQRVGKDILVGFKERRTNMIVPIMSCDILHPDIFASFEKFKMLGDHFLTGATKSMSVFVTVTETGLDVDLSGGPDETDLTLAQREAIAEITRELDFTRVTMNGGPFLTPRTPVVKFSGVPVELPARGFLQATKDGEETLIRLVQEHIGGAKNIADLFSGCGTFSLSLACKARIYAAESITPSIDALSQAASRAELPVTAVVRDLDHQPLMPPELNEFDAVVFDPPRAGAEAQVTQLAKSDVPRIVGVSCNPQTFTRDAAILRDGGYRLLSVQPVDQFLFTPHIELVGSFVRD